MIVSFDLEKILPEAYRYLRFEPMDELTLQHVKQYYNQVFDTGSVVGWTQPDYGPNIDIAFETETDAVMFMLKVA